MVQRAGEHVQVSASEDLGRHACIELDGQRHPSHRRCCQRRQWWFKKRGKDKVSKDYEAALNPATVRQAPGPRIRHREHGDIVADEAAGRRRNEGPRACQPIGNRPRTRTSKQTFTLRRNRRPDAVINIYTARGRSQHGIHDRKGEEKDGSGDRHGQAIGKVRVQAG